LEEEVVVILKRMGVENEKVDFDFELNETVRLKEGPFANYTGTIEEIDIEKQKVKVLVDMFGRETPVELDFVQVEKL
jgi:transcriptional antiterminator NusG